MKKCINLIIVMAFVLLISFFVISKKIFSENENRNLTKFPEYSLESIFSGNFTKNLEVYINDHFPFRDEFLSLKTKVELKTFKKLINDVYVTDKSLYLKYNKNNDLESVVGTLNKFYESNKDIEMNLLLIPSSSYINEDLLPNFVDSALEEKDLNYIKNNLKINTIDVISNLKKENKKNSVYFKSDHHYNLYGAYSVYKSFCEFKKISMKDIKFTKANNNFLGTLSSKVNVFNKYEDEIYYYETDVLEVDYSFKKDNSLYDYNYLDKKDKYSFFMGGNHAFTEIKTNVNNQKSILILKDSYANSFIPFLTDNYEYIYVIDLRFYNLPVSSILEEKEIQEVLFLYSTNGFNKQSGINLLR